MVDFCIIILEPLLLGEVAEIAFIRVGGYDFFVLVALVYALH